MWRRKEKCKSGKTHLFHSNLTGGIMMRTSKHVHVTNVSFSLDDAPACWARGYGSEALIFSVYGCCISVCIWDVF